MSRAQELIVAYVRTQWIMSEIKVDLKGDAVVIVTDRKGEKLELTCNVYGDIMEVGSEKILAKSDLPHDSDELNPEAVPKNGLLIRIPEFDGGEIQMDKEYLSIKEFANLAGISRQAVYKQLNNQLTPYLKVIDGKKMLDKSGLELFDKQDNCKPVDNDFANQLVNQLTTELTEKGQQLKEKDKQISEKDKQIAEKDKQLAALQKLLDQEQHLHALTLQRVAELEDKQQESMEQMKNVPEDTDGSNQAEEKRWWEFWK